MTTTKVISKATKILDQKTLVSQVKKMLDHFESYNFINLKNSTSSKLGFHSENIKQTIKYEWLFSNTVVCDHPVFQFKSLKNETDYKNAFEKAKNFVTTVPFNFVEVDYSDDNTNNKNCIDYEACPVDLIKNLFENCSGTTLKCQTLCSPANALEIFHKHLRDRKIWWRKFSAWPERFHTTEIVTNSNNKSQCVEIQAEFPWGIETVERIIYLPEVLWCKDNFFEIKSRKNAFIPQVILCETLLEKVVLTYICDAYEGINYETDREILRFNKQLAPYKVAFAAAEHPKHSQNLQDLAFLLTKKIQKCGIPVLLLPEAVCSQNLDNQFLQNDAIGIPFTILLNENTLRDGILYIRSRDTTLKEDSHASLVVSHVEKLFRKY